MDNSERNLAPFLVGMDNLARFKGFKFCNYGQFSIDLSRESSKMEQILNFQVPSEGLELVISLHTQY